MIFSLSGTGNSLHLARAVAEITGDEVRELGRVPEGTVDVSSMGTVGFVFPVWYYDMPERLKEIISGHFRFGRDQIVWAAMTYGTTPGNACARTVRFFESQGVDLRFALGYQMPENYIMLFTAPGREEIERLQSEVPDHAREIADELAVQDVLRPRTTVGGSLISFFAHPFYNVFRKTRKFRVTDRCTGCGTCAEICPAPAIEMRDGRPVWTEKRCLHCAACINRCPVHAIEYGRGTVGKERYVDPHSGY